MKPYVAATSDGVRFDDDVFEVADYLADPQFAAAYEDAQARASLLRELIVHRKAIGMRQADVAAHMQTTQSFVSQLERGQTDPQLSTLQRYARAVAATLTVMIDLPAKSPWQPDYQWVQSVRSTRYAGRTFSAGQPAVRAAERVRPLGLWVVPQDQREKGRVA